MAERRGRPALRPDSPVRARMKGRGMRVEELAEALSLSIPQTYRIISGQCRPKRRQARLLRALLGMSLEEIYLGG